MNPTNTVFGKFSPSELRKRFQVVFL